MLTPEVKLAQEYKVSRNTIRHAISQLAKEGYWGRIPGKETFFLKRNGELTREKWLVSSVEVLFEATILTEVEFEAMELLDKPPTFTLRDLRLKKRNKVCYFVGIKYWEKEAISYLQVFLPYEIGVHINEKELGQGTIFLY